jgi:hypothetical protein
VAIKFHGLLIGQAGFALDDGVDVEGELGHKMSDSRERGLAITGQILHTYCFQVI